VTISFGCILYCGCFHLFCNVRVCVCVGFVMWGCFGNMFTCIYCVLNCLYCIFVLFRLCIFILICFVCNSVWTTAIEWKLNCSNNNNNNNLLTVMKSNAQLHTVPLYCAVFKNVTPTLNYGLQYACPSDTWCWPNALFAYICVLLTPRASYTTRGFADENISTRTTFTGAQCVSLFVTHRSLRFLAPRTNYSAAVATPIQLN
jgi:hypothetical protein